MNNLGIGDKVLSSTVSFSIVPPWILEEIMVDMNLLEKRNEKYNDENKDIKYKLF